MPLSTSPDKQTALPVTPHFPGGFIQPDQLQKLAAVAARYGGTLKITGSSITILGIPAANRHNVLAELAVAPESFTAGSIRGVTMCPGKPHCPRGQQDSTALGLELDKRFFGQEVPGKLRMAVSGCPNCCAEVYVKDIGLFATAKGYTLVAGGNAGRNARKAQHIATSIPAEEVPHIIDRIVEFYRTHSHPKERLSQLIDRMSLSEFTAQTIPSDYRKPQ